MKTIQATEHERHSAKKNALVVDDGAVERLVGKAMLEKLGFSVLTANSGEEALHLIAQYSIDLVLCDVAMPGMDGLTLLDKASSWPPAPIFIMSTNYDDAEHAIASMRRGARAHMVKPLRLTNLRKTVSEAMTDGVSNQVNGLVTPQPAQRDPLCRIMNTGEFTRRVGSLLQTTRAAADSSVLILLRLRGVGLISRRHGRTVANTVLHFAGSALSMQISPSDAITRLGGSLFALYLQSGARLPHDAGANGMAIDAACVNQRRPGKALGLGSRTSWRCRRSAIEIGDLFERA